jgi:serine/threonine-protein kinase
LLPQRIGKYEVVGKLGQGAMGEVFHARDPSLGRNVAVKRITAGLDADETVRRRFRREAEAAARLMHPNIVTVYELGTEGGQLFMAMELLDGVDLKQAIAAGRMTLDEKVGVTLQVCEGVAFAHSHDVVHRDLKPANIRVQPDGVAKIMDFGLVRVGDSNMTRTGTLMGSPAYMSPEVLMGSRADARADIFSLGAVFYELLCGQRAFPGRGIADIMMNVLKQEPQPLASCVPALPAPVVFVVERCLRKDATRRYQVAAELHAALEVAQAACSGR